MDGWNVIGLLFGPAYFQELLMQVLGSVMSTWIGSYYFELGILIRIELFTIFAVCCILCILHIFELFRITCTVHIDTLIHLQVKQFMKKQWVNINNSLKQETKKISSHFKSFHHHNLYHNHFLRFLTSPLFFFRCKLHMSHPSLPARQIHLWKQWVVAHCLDPVGINQNSWTVKATPRKINGWNIIPWRFGSDDFPFQMGDGCRFQPLIFRECTDFLIAPLVLLSPKIPPIIPPPPGTGYVSAGWVMSMG